MAEQNRTEQNRTEQNRTEQGKLTGFPSIDKPWLKYYTEEAINVPLPDVSMVDYLAEQNQQHAALPAIRYLRTSITYKQLFERIDRTAAAFLASGINRGDIVTILSLMTPETVYCIYGLNRIGAVANMGYLSLSEQEIIDMVHDTESKMLIVLEILTEKISRIMNQLPDVPVLVLKFTDALPVPLRMLARLRKPNTYGKIGISWQEFISARYCHWKKTPDVSCQVEARDPAMIVYTSGTTGRPKGVVHGSYSFNAIAHQYRYSGMKFKSGDTILSFVPPFLAVGFSLNVHMPLALGLTVCLCPNPHPEHISAEYCKIRPVHFVAAPSNILQIIDRLKGDMGFCKTFAGGGESMDLEKEKQVNAFLQTHQSQALYNTGYGMTEFAATVTTNLNHIHKVGSLGIPLCHCIVKIVDPDTLQERTYGEIGEMCFQTPSAMISYRNLPKDTQAVMRQHDDGKIWIHTGDLGYVDKDGFVWFKGRIKRIYMTIGRDGVTYKIFPARVEELLNAVNGVKSSAVIVISDSEVLQQMVAFLVLENEEQQKTKSTVIKRLDQYCRDHLPEHSVPVRYEIVDSLPYTLSGKIDYRKLESMAK